MGTLDGRLALVTGAGQGVGAGIASALASEGATLALAGRTLSKLERTREQIIDRGGRARAFEVDIADTDRLPAFVDEVAGELGGLDIVINNAYSGRLGPLLDLSVEDFQQGFVSGPFAAFALMKASHPHLKARGGGDIINLVTSAMVRWDGRNYGAYASAKHALRSLSRTAAVEWGPDDIRVNSIAPHAMSPALQWWTENNPEEAREFVAGIPLGRIGDCEADIGRAVVALLGPDLRYLTGATIPLDGGQAYFG